jgi:voltage-gated potassium channel
MAMTQSATRNSADRALRESDAYLLGKPAAGWRRRVFNVVFESDTHAGKLFDIILIVVILLSVAAVLADSVASVALRHGTLLTVLEWIFTALFTLEYITRLSCVERPMRYVRSFYGIVDLMAVLPTYLAAFFPEAALLIDVRILRLLRILRIFKLTAYLTEYRLLADAIPRAAARSWCFYRSW